MSNVYRLGPAGAYPEGSKLHGSSYAYAYLKGDPEFRLGTLRDYKDGTFGAVADTEDGTQDGFETETAAIEWLLQKMLSSGQYITNRAQEALANL